MAQGVQYLPIRYPREAPAWFTSFMDSFIKDVLTNADVRNAIPGNGIEITGQPDQPATISNGQDLQQLIDENYVLAEPSTFLVNARVLEGENGVISVEDGGPGQPIVVGIYPGGIQIDKLGQMIGLSVLGRPEDSTGVVSAITGAAQHDVLSIQLDGSDLEVVFGTITHESVSDFDEAAQDSVGGILAASDTVTFTYDDATPEITADVVTQMSVTSDSSGVMLVNDETSPGASMVYGTDGGGNKGWQASGGGGGGIDPAVSFDDFWECFAGISTTGDDWDVATQGSGSGLTQQGEDGHPGIWRLSTGTTTTGFTLILRTDVTTSGAGIVLGTTDIVVSALVRFPVLPDGTQTFTLPIGLFNAWASPSNRCSAVVRWNGSAAVWSAQTQSGGGGIVSVDASSAPVINTWYYIELHCSTTSIRLYVNGVLEATNSTSVPTAAMALGAGAAKSAGSGTAGVLDIDFIRCQQTFSTPRY